MIDIPPPSPRSGRGDIIDMKMAHRCLECGRSFPDLDLVHRCGDLVVDRDLRPIQIFGPEDIPDGVSGDVRIDRMVLKRDTNVGGSWRRPSFMGAGETVVRLLRRGSLWMSDTPDEVRDQRFHIQHEDGKGPTILIGGLGLGIAIRRVDERCIPERVVVVEIDPDVIALVAPTYAHLHWLEIVEGDIRGYGRIGPRGFFDVAWVDIWGNYSSDLLSDMFGVRRGLGRVMKSGRIPGVGSRVQLWKECEILRLRSVGR